MVEDAGADHVLEGLSKLIDTLDGELTYLEIVEGVFVFQLERAGNAGGTNVDADQAGVRPAQRIARSLRRAATRDQYAAVVAERLRGPEEVRVGTPAPVIPTGAVCIEIVDRRRVRVTFVKVTHPSADFGSILGLRRVSRAAFEPGRGPNPD